MSRLCAKGLADKTFTAAQLFTCIVCVHQRYDAPPARKREREGKGEEEGTDEPKQLFLWEGYTELISQYQCIPSRWIVARINYKTSLANES